MSLLVRVEGELAVADAVRGAVADQEVRDADDPDFLAVDPNRALEDGLIEGALAECDEFARAIDPLGERPLAQVGDGAEPV